MVKGQKKLRNPDLVCVFVLLNADERDEFYVFRLEELQQYCAKIYSRGKPFPVVIKRPRNAESTHCAVRPHDWQAYRAKEDSDWSLITNQFNPIMGAGEQAAPPNGGPAISSGSPGAQGGPPSVS